METKAKYILEFEKPLGLLQEQLEQLRSGSVDKANGLSKQINILEKQLESIKKEIYSNLSPWQRIQIARHPDRPYALDYIDRLFENFQELHGDRLYGDDQALIGGLATFDKKPVMILAQQKGRTTKEKVKRNFGSPNPEGYRKALRLMKMAERFHIPIISIIDTAGAFPGTEGEERHIAEAIAVNIREMSTIKVPIIAVIIGEGGSGGALGVGVADTVMILENAYYSVISPEGCAAILWKDRTFAPQAAQALKITAPELLSLGLLDTIVTEPLGGAHHDYNLAAKLLQDALKINLKSFSQTSTETLLEKRYQKYRKMGAYTE